MQVNLPELIGRPLFIVFEGVDGVGKSTQVELLRKHLEDEGFKVSTTAEAKGTPLADVIRSEYLSGKRKVSNITNALSFSADRYDRFTNEEDGVIQKLESGETVIADRWIHSSMVYSALHYIDDKKIDTCMSLMRDINLPLADAIADHSFMIEFNLHIKQGDIGKFLERINSRSDKPKEIYETGDNLRKVEMLYNRANTLWTRNCVRINVSADQSAEDVHTDIWEYLTKRIMNIGTQNYQ